MNRRRTLTGTLLAVAVALTACSSVPLPGGEGGGGYRVVIRFADVTDLVPYSAVKVDDVTVGQVEEVSLADDWTAEVLVSVNADVALPDNATAALRQTSLLGEKFVELSPPLDHPSDDPLGDGDVIGLDRTDRGAEVEEVLGALALVLQGGGLEQLRTINTELVALMQGREADITDTLGELESFLAALDGQRENIVTALEALERLSADLADQTDTIRDALDAIAPGITVLADQEQLISDGIVALGELGEVGTEVIEGAGDETIAILNDLQPVLENLVAAGDDFPQGLELALSYPFPYNASDAVHDDFVNLHITLDVDVAAILDNVAGDKPTEQVDPDNPESSGDQGIEPVIGGLTELLGIGLAGLTGGTDDESGTGGEGDTE
ncbi:phospholipid/cholesterol/gamma-HCH transport system substrate-binding protein [Stackebrandtia albiflava]|uniref:Phospholipid/cholesterol/gamma-HCH transport system substrate-binding protein n=1 Tax=Stackebrandtia albiflava TaxID=406432 RepID=A0A562V3A0_9ACTN|nr:MCE family protein [Stackebrandtia albiflava]TWJ12335.1 phospholipid/cholesterol/gamma-HCH transport system substrate-binding protein [Stackebrandtia albiflava]